MMKKHRYQAKKNASQNGNPYRPGGDFVMIQTSMQLKALVRNLSDGDSAKTQTIIRAYASASMLSC